MPSLQHTARFKFLPCGATSWSSHISLCHVPPPPHSGHLRQGIRGHHPGSPFPDPSPTQHVMFCPTLPKPALRVPSGERPYLPDPVAASGPASLAVQLLVAEGPKSLPDRAALLPFPLSRPLPRAHLPAHLPAVLLFPRTASSPCIFSNPCSLHRLLHTCGFHHPLQAGPSSLAVLP